MEFDTTQGKAALTRKNGQVYLNLNGKSKGILNFESLVHELEQLGISRIGTGNSLFTYFARS